jgi:hypothetical protein
MSGGERERRYFVVAPFYRAWGAEYRTVMLQPHLLPDGSGHRCAHQTAEYHFFVVGVFCLVNIFCFVMNSTVDATLLTPVEIIPSHS